MHYNVIVTANIKQQHANHAPVDMPSEIKNLFRELLNSSTGLTSEGTLRSRKNGRIELSYRADDGREMTISFVKNEPSLVALTRGESLFENAVTIYLEEGRRHRSISYDLRGDRLEVTVLASKVDNRLLKSGKMNLSYEVYVCGVCAEITEMNISIVRDTEN